MPTVRYGSTLLVAISLIVACAGCGIGAGNEAPAAPETPVTENIGPDESGFYPPSEARHKIVECLQSDGWTVTEDERPGMEGYEAEVTTAQEAAFKGAEVECQEKYPIQESSPADWSDQTWQDLYDADVRTAECLREEGYSVPEEPSLETYRETYETPEVWTAYGEAFPQGEGIPSDWVGLNEKCPQPGSPGNEVDGL